MTRNRKILIAVFATTIVFWIVSWFVIDIFLYPESNLEGSTHLSDRGAFGDKFGFINSLFSGLALGGIIISIIIQQEELILQRKELAETREEFKEQNFQTTFFSLLKTQRQLADDISTVSFYQEDFGKYKKLELKGRNFFIQSRRELEKIIRALRHEKYSNIPNDVRLNEYFHEEANEFEISELLIQDELAHTNEYYEISELTWNKSKEKSNIDIAYESYNAFFNRYHFVIGHYFRHLYHILNYLKEAENEKLLDKNLKENEKSEIKKNFMKYANFIQAQMSTAELFLLFYNALAFPKTLELIKKYNLLENLTEEDLVEQEHNVVEGVTLKSRENLIKD